MGGTRCNNNRQWQATTPTNRPAPIMNGLPPSLTAAQRKFASTRKLLHNKIQRRILIVALICREYIKDASVNQVAAVNTFGGRGEEEEGTNRTDINTALSEQPHTNPPPTVVTKQKRN